MKRIIAVLLLAAVIMVAPVVYGATAPTKASGNTVWFTRIGSPVATENVVTFNSVTKHIMLQNYSTVSDCYVDVRCVDDNGNRGYISTDSTVLMVPAVGRATPNTVELDFATMNLGFRADKDQQSSTNSVKDSNQKISYFVTGDQGAL